MLYVFYGLVLSLLTIYSYSQIDLNLTLSGNWLYQYFQNQLIYLGYFNRPLSTAVFLILLFLLFIVYYLILYLIKHKKLSFTNLKWLIILSCVILFFSYSAFSHDLFNYVFDARIVTKYGQNPYLYSALDFPSDLWTRFMHWTHRTYPYGPVWLILTLPVSLLGFSKFLLTIFNFKLLFLAFHIGNVYLINKILKKTDSKLSLLGTAVYAFNPVVLIESLVSPHNEVVMLFFLLLAIYQMFVKNNRLIALLSLLLSGGIKFITLILLPLLFIRKKIKILEKDNFWLLLSLILLSFTLIIEIIFREPYSWYFIPLIGVGALLIKYESINILLAGFSFGALLRYAPYLYLGEYSLSTSNMQNIIFWLTGLSAIFIILIRVGVKKFYRALR